MPAVTKDMLIGEVAQKHPQAIEIMLGQGLHCIGCFVSPYETIEQGAKGHGFSDQQVDELVEQINAKIGGETALPEPIVAERQAHFTKEAADKLKSLMQAEGKIGFGLRVSEVGGKGSGSFEMDFDQSNPQSDRVFESHEIMIFYDNSLHDKLKGIEIHYRESPQAGFVIRNPNQV